jgi:hypothetical protein
LLPSLAAFGVLSDRADVRLEDDLWRRGGTDYVGEPPSAAVELTVPRHDDPFSHGRLPFWE